MRIGKKPSEKTVKMFYMPKNKYLTLPIIRDEHLGTCSNSKPCKIRRILKDKLTLQCISTQTKPNLLIISKSIVGRF